MHNRLKISLAAIVFTSFFGTNLMAAQSDIDAEISQYIAIFEADDLLAERKVMDKLNWAGHTSEALYDVIEKELNLIKNADDKESKRQASWYAKSLSTSGNDKYRETLKDVAANSSNKKARKHAAIALDRIDVYKTWNSVISANLADAPVGRLEEARIKNMLNSDDYELVRVGAKRISFEHYQDQELIELSKARLTKEWRLVSQDNTYQLDAVAWLIRNIGSANDTSGLPLLNEIKNESKIKKLRKYAAKSIKVLQ